MIAASAQRKCAVQYAGGLIKRICDRTEGHAGPHSGDMEARYARQRRATPTQTEGH